MTRISSSSGTRPTISRMARRTIGPIVSSSFSVGRTSETVTPCFSLSWTRRRRSPNSAWWKFDSPNQRSTRVGTARASSAARSAAARLSALRRELVERRAADLLAGLDDHDGRLGAGGDGLGERPEQERFRAVAARHGGGAHHHEIGLLGLAQDGVADVGRLAQDGLALAVAGAA